MLFLKTTCVHTSGCTSACSHLHVARIDWVRYSLRMRGCADEAQCSALCESVVFSASGESLSARYAAIRFSMHYVG
eukprot:2663968-Pyramimonas_sp.AAC.1